MTAATPSEVLTGNAYRTGRWSAKEKKLFIDALSLYGHGPFRWKRISGHVGTRTPVQCKTHHQKLVNKAEREYAKRSEADRGGPAKEECVVQYRMVLETAKRYRHKQGSLPAVVEKDAAECEEVTNPALDSQGGNSHATSNQSDEALPCLQDSSISSYGRWTEHEKKLYSEAMTIYGKGRWKLVSKYVGTRTSTQCKTHHQKVMEKQSKCHGMWNHHGEMIDEQFADAEEYEVPGQEEKIVARALCDYRHGKPEKSVLI
eukprot:CAMPEP_0183295718 /NCGR_PEP_ID=MMETSP0160_2-20130417/3574_1 /TAXON_ID=2839 ORGANISM="Odontella Sinensis, Strain Grunow 1884" /NCGR_SAMPLE_ID=MMETSP0160_2 /ASSEMBLY_ACC=CAM_ASM_000250 /LENGTH=258 /DNA_ID=CAMNT_0025457245 /DNA_START=33 /DNA_END=809 /DNA_ORIENTATION=+